MAGVGTNRHLAKNRGKSEDFSTKSSTPAFLRELGLDPRPYLYVTCALHVQLGGDAEEIRGDLRKVLQGNIRPRTQTGSRTSLQVTNVRVFYSMRTAEKLCGILNRYLSRTQEKSDFHVEQEEEDCETRGLLLPMDPRPDRDPASQRTITNEEQESGNTRSLPVFENRSRLAVETFSLTVTVCCSHTRIGDFLHWTWALVKQSSLLLRRGLP